MEPSGSTPTICGVGVLRAPVSPGHARLASGCSPAPRSQDSKPEAQAQVLEDHMLNVQLGALGVGQWEAGGSGFPANSSRAGHLGQPWRDANGQWEPGARGRAGMTSPGHQRNRQQERICGYHQWGLSEPLPRPKCPPQISEPRA